MRLQKHTAISLTISAILYMMFRSWELAVANLITGIFIDLDHIYDYMREHSQSLNLKDFFRVNNNAQYNRIFLFCHAWEWLVLLAIITWATDWNPWLAGILIGYTQHLLLDTFNNDCNFISYSLIWRWTKNFEFDIVFPAWKDIKYKHKQSLRT